MKEKPVQHFVEDSIDTTATHSDDDARRLESLGYKQEFDREISLFVQAGFAFSCMGVLPNWLVGFAGTMNAGGPMSLFWGFVVVAPFVTLIALAMSELFSAFPVNGGVYSWCYLLSSPEWGPLMSWICGYIFLAGQLSTAMTLAYSLGEYIIATWNIANTYQIDNQGANIGIYVAVLILGITVNACGLKFNAWLNRVMIGWVTIGTLIIVIATPLMAPTHPSGKWVFSEFQNYTGWDNVGLVFLLGMSQAGWCLIGYENGAHLAEGTRNASRSGPFGILFSIVGAVVQALVLCIGTLFSIQDVKELQESSFPVATLFLRATNREMAVFFLVIVTVTQFGCLCNIMLAEAQLMWSMSRDKCMPYHHFWYKLHSKRRIPLRIMILQAFICAIVILPSLGSKVYWSAIMSTAIICINVSYGLPYVCRLIWSRNKLPKGPFNLGKWSIPINIAAVTWVVFFSVVLCFPSTNPVNPITMNWSCLMVGAAFLLSLVFWFTYGREHYQGPVQTLQGDSK
ncbi:apc amino acid permease [Lichtheimia corymbifera JMRC:FSU:9682]|uniref:Apc amino acid permease n=1 Tax=Lichtheimia corymbifera JMRC:FSU:9682 TaxID=1263082 RepID=A0A068RZG7_9FUNG|nr:apc amino acid permease [Lichtheimia corymbifera JMRC:FSU:9682]